MSTTTQPILAIPIHHPKNTTDHQNHRISSTTLNYLKQIHAQIIKTTNKHELIVPKITDSLGYAFSVFIQLPNPSTRLSNKLLRELSKASDPEKTLLVYRKMRREGVFVDRFNFPRILKAVSRIIGCGVFEGMEIHGFALKMGLGEDQFVQTGLVRMYSGLGRVFEARVVFDRMSQRDVVAWNVVINGYCQSGLYDHALLLYEEMKSSNVKPDEILLCTVFSACGRAGNLNYGKSVHESIISNNIEIDTHLQSALITMYASCGSMDLAQNLLDKMSRKSLVASTAMVSGYSKAGHIEAARSVFDHMVEKDLVCWSAMISGYAESDSPDEALKLFNNMKIQGILPDQVTMLSVISACAHLGALDQAKLIHIYVENNEFEGMLSINNALIDMYAKCGSLEKAKIVFDRMPRKNVISWTAMINAFAIHGDALNAVKLFHLMKDENIEPNMVTFVGVLYACSHGGLVDEGRKIFSSMTNEHNISPKHEHYGCMVDLLGRANLLREALEFVEAMPLPPNVIVWGALMAACRVHGDTELGEYAAKRVLEIEPDHDGALVVLSNIYAKEKRWGDAGEVRKTMKNKGITKERGWSRIELKNETHEFLTADKNHKQANEIYEKLDEVVKELRLAGYTPDTYNVLINVEEEKKEELVLRHSEKLALCLGLISEKKTRSSICIVKNLRICEDCHTFMKLVSKVYEKDIVVRDRSRFHHCKNGICSCKDYW